MLNILTLISKWVKLIRSPNSECKGPVKSLLCNPESKIYAALHIHEEENGLVIVIYREHSQACELSKFRRK